MKALTPARAQTPALLRAFPILGDPALLPWLHLGRWPSPVARLAGLDAAAGGPLFVKRDDEAAEVHGGNKVRSLEPLLGAARARRAEIVWTSGGFGSNHALATVLFAREAGLRAGVLLCPQPYSDAAARTARALVVLRPEIRVLASWALLPFAERAARRLGGEVLPPGGATPVGALGFASAALELAEQIRAGALPAPRRIVLPLGSGGSAAGLLAGLAIAAGIGWLAAPDLPAVWAVRVVPWPITWAPRVLDLARRTLALVAELAGRPDLRAGRSLLAGRLRLVGGHVGRGYGHPTREGLLAIERFAAAGGPPLDPVYSGKAAACLLAHPAPGPTLFWATKSSRPLPPSPPSPPDDAPARLRRWLEAGARAHARRERAP